MQDLKLPWVYWGRIIHLHPTYLCSIDCDRGNILTWLNFNGNSTTLNLRTWKRQKISEVLTVDKEMTGLKVWPRAPRIAVYTCTECCASRFFLKTRRRHTWDFYEQLETAACISLHSETFCEGSLNFGLKKSMVVT